jgi:hypothetical protein
MRNKRAKLIRKTVKETVGHLPAVAYRIKKHVVQAFLPELSPTTGLRTKVPQERSQTLLDGCQRSIYQQTKKAYMAGGFTHG